MADLYTQHEKLFQRLGAFVESLPGVPGPFLEKYRMMADPPRARKRTRLLEYELRVACATVRGAVVLDAGCGTGLYSVMFALLGAARVEAVDYFAENVEFLARVAKEFSLPIVPHHQDIVHTGFDAGSVRLVYCTEAISHFHDWTAFLDEGARVLGSGGRILIADGNNGANLIVKRGILDFWEESEIGPFTTTGRYAPGQNMPYLFRRWMIVRREFPEATDEQVYTLGLHTSHLGGPGMIEACRDYFRTGTLPGAPYRRGQSQIRPEDGQHNEEPIHPAEIVARLRARGLSARARPHFGYGRSPLLPLLNEIGSRFSGIALPFANRYLVIGGRS
jgi:SAM-dependent methyltransferase